MRVDQNVPGWRASVRTSYAGCSSGNHELNYGEHFTEPRGGCLLTKVHATMFQGDEAVDAWSYTSSGTAYSHFQIVNGSEDSTGYRFCVRRADTPCRG